MNLQQRMLALGVNVEEKVERFLSRRWFFGPVVFLVATPFAVRWAVVALSVPTVGPDYGHYLIAANWYAGLDRSGEGPFDLPLVPLLFLALAPLLGQIVALQLLGPLALSSMFLASVFFLVRYVPRWVAIAGSAVFVQWQTFLEFITSGGVTNLFGIAFSLVFFRFFYDALEKPVVGWRPRKKEVLAATTLFLIASTHHFTTFVVGATVLAWLGIHLVVGRRDRRASASTAFRAIAPGAAMSLVYLPYFLRLVATDAVSGLGQPTSPAVLASAIEYAWQSTPGIWIAFFALAALSIVRFRRSTPFAPLVGALVFTPVILDITVLASHPVRILFFLQFPLVFLAVIWLATDRPSHFLRLSSGHTRAIGGIACVGLLAVALVALPGSSQARQLDGVGFYHQFMNVQTLDAFDWIKAHTATDTTFAVDAGPSPAYNDMWKGMATGWWLQGYTNRRAIYEANPPLLPFLARWEEAREANRLFAGETTFEDGVLRVADSFPFDDAASPKVHTGYFLDFHEFVGFAVPRVVNSTTGEAFTLVLGADPRYDRGLVNGRGWVSGNYSGPGFTATRVTSYDYASTTVSLDIAFAFGLSPPWDAFEMTIRIPAWTQLDLAGLGQETIDARVLDVTGYGMEAGRIEFVSSNLTTPSQVPQLGSPGEVGVGLRWKILASTATLRATVLLTKLPTTGPSPHAPLMKTSDQILSNHAVDFLFVTTDSISNIQRFDRQPSRFSRAFANPAVVIFDVT